jgi:hypothetical protein
MADIKLQMTLDGDGSPLDDMYRENEKDKIRRVKQRIKDEAERAKAERQRKKGRR